MKGQRKKEEKENFDSSWLEVDADGNLIIIQFYPNDYWTSWIVTSVINVDDILYFISR
jgi:hypothetical protein